MLCTGMFIQWLLAHSVLYILCCVSQRKIMTSLSEAFVHLDMTGAVRDIRRFNYVKTVSNVKLQMATSKTNGLDLCQKDKDVLLITISKNK